MIHGVGIDLASSTRIKKLVEKFGIKFARKILSKNELRAYEIKNTELSIAEKFLEKSKFHLQNVPAQKGELGIASKGADPEAKSNFLESLKSSADWQQFAAEKFFKLRNFDNFLTKRFAAKEAFSKAVGLGIGRGINFEDIEISNNYLGKPQIELVNGKSEFLKNHLNSDSFAIHLSFSDQGSDVAAVVIVEKI